MGYTHNLIGETITVPIHMKNALQKALNDFAKTGYHYVIWGCKEHDETISFVMDTTAQQAIALGIKIGYNLKAEENEC